MAKGGRNKHQKNSQVAMDSDEDMYDETDKFHKEDRAIGAGKVKQRKARRVEEVLNVEGDASSADEIEDDESDFGSDNQEGKLPSRDRWGMKKRNFYSAGYVDNDYGGVGSSDEEEMAELEEADALARQRQLDGAAAVEGEEDVWANEQTEHTHAKSKRLIVEKKWTLSTVKKTNEKVRQFRDELSRRRSLYEVIVRPLHSLVDALPPKSTTRRQLLLATDVYSSYIINLSLFISLKASSLKAKKANDVAVDEHPVLQDIARLAKMVNAADSYLERNGDALRQLLDRVNGGLSIQGAIRADVQLPKSKKLDMPEEDMAEEMEEGEEEAYEDLGDGKRAVSYAIKKNKLLKSKKKKGPGHSRAQKRKQYDKALIKRRSQVADMRHETSRYSGESRGIRVSTVKSTKLVA